MARPNKIWFRKEATARPFLTVHSPIVRRHATFRNRGEQRLYFTTDANHNVTSVADVFGVVVRIHRQLGDKRVHGLHF